MTISSKFRTGLNNGAPGGIAIGGDSPEGVSFDGTNDYLSRSSDLVGNADGKTFTFSLFAYLRNNPSDNQAIYVARDTTTNYRFLFSVGSSNPSIFRIIGRNTSNIVVFQLECDGEFTFDTWVHILVSIDLTNSSNRYVYINDRVPTNVLWDVFTNDNIDFAVPYHSVSELHSGQQKITGRLSHLFLDHTYRDLSVEANRRLFIDSDGKPADIQANFASSTIGQAVADTFSTTIYTGTHPTPQTITNGIDLATDGGMVWLRCRSERIGASGIIYDTERGISKYLQTQTTAGEGTAGNGAGLTAFNSDGFTLGTSWATENFSPYDYVSWTFKKESRYFDVVTWTGNGVLGRDIAHNLGIAPGMVIIKGLNGDYWAVYHRSLGTDYRLFLNNDGAVGNASLSYWNATDPTSTHFTIGDDGSLNDLNYPYVAYVFAHDPLGAAGDGSDGKIACGTYTGNSGTNVVNLGWEAQYVLIKRTNAVGNWITLDTVRPYGELLVNSDMDEQVYTQASSPFDYHSDGFALKGDSTDYNLNGSSYIYMAIRKNPDQTPPILHLPLIDAATAHVNEGTGGDFTQNGTLDTAGRGANQNNCVASTPGVGQYLKDTSWDTVEATALTVSFIARANESSGEDYIISQPSGGFYSIPRGIF